MVMTASKSVLIEVTSGSPVPALPSAEVPSDLPFDFVHFLSAGQHFLVQRVSPFHLYHWHLPAFTMFGHVAQLHPWSSISTCLLKHLLAVENNISISTIFKYLSSQSPRKGTGAESFEIKIFLFGKLQWRNAMRSEAIQVTQSLIPFVLLTLPVSLRSWRFPGEVCAATHQRVEVEPVTRRAWSSWPN